MCIRDSNHLAWARPDLSAGVPFYGTPASADDTAKIKAAMLIHHGEMDTRLAGTWPAYDAALTAAGVKHEGYIYPGAQHGFHNDTTPRYDEAAAKLAWSRTLEWFNKYLRGDALRSSSPPGIPTCDVASEPVFVQIEAKPRPFWNWKYAVSNHRLRTLRHLFFVAAESAESILDLEEILCCGSD